MLLETIFIRVPGIGIGLLFVPVNVIVQQYFNQRRPLAIGIVGAGLSSGTLIFAPILRLLISTFGWRGGLIIMSGAMMQGLVFVALLRPLNFMEKGNPVVRDDEVNANTSKDLEKHLTEESTSAKMRPAVKLKKKAKQCLQYFDLQLFKELRFVLFLMGRTLAYFGTFIMYKYNVSNAIVCGIDSLQAAFLVTCIGTFSTLLRFTVGAIASIRCLRPYRVLAESVGIIVGGTFVMMISLGGSNFAIHVVLCVAFGISLG